MNVLDKILEEIERLEDPYYKDYVDRKYVKEIIHSHMGGAIDTDDTEEKIREHIAECLHRIDNIRSFIGSKEYTSNDEKCIRNIEVLKTIITALEEYLSSKKKNGNDGWIDRKNLKEEIKSLRFTITGMRNGKTMTKLALEEYRKSILKIIDEQPTYMDDGWIPVEDRLPEEHDSIFAKFKGTSKWNGAMWEKQSDEVNVTYELEDGTRKATTSYTLDGVWKLQKRVKLSRKKL